MSEPLPDRHQAKQPVRTSFDAAYLPRALAVVLASGLTLVPLFASPLLHLSANRLVVGEPVYASTVLGALRAPIVGLVLVGYGLGAVRSHRLSRTVAPFIILAALALLMATLGSAAHVLNDGQPTAARVRLASGSILSGAMIACALAWAIRSRPVVPTLLVWVVSAAFCLGLGWFGQWNALSIVIEFHMRRQEILAATGEHLVLSGQALLLAALITAVLFVARRMRTTVEQAIAGLQVVPAVALFGALVVAISTLLNAVPALRELGVSALGSVPAVIGIAVYLLLPLWRGLRASLDSADVSAIEAAEAVGLTRFQVLTSIRMPAGAGVLVGALRVSAVQSLGLTTLAALVGAGGLGQIVFDGMAQFSIDLIVLGALPILVLSFAADRILAIVEGKLSHR